MVDDPDLYMGRTEIQNVLLELTECVEALTETRKVFIQTTISLLRKNTEILQKTAYGPVWTPCDCSWNEEGTHDCETGQLITRGQKLIKIGEGMLK